MPKSKQYEEVLATVAIRRANAEKGIYAFTKEAAMPVDIEVSKMYTNYLPDKPSPGEALAIMQSGNKLSNMFQRIRKSMLPILVRRDNFMSRAILNEYVMSWYEHAWQTTNYIGIPLKFGAPKQDLIDAAYKYPLNKISDSAKMAAARLQSIQRLQNVITEGLQDGLTFREMNVRMDQYFGFRDSNGKLLPKNNTRKGGELYKAARSTRTELSRLRAFADHDAMIKAQGLEIDERLQLVSVRDDRTRSQSAAMDMQISNKEGQFKYPNDKYYQLGMQPARWSINDRETSVPYLPEFDVLSPKIAERVLSSDKTQQVDFRSWEEYAKSQNITANRYGEKYTFS